MTFFPGKSTVSSSLARIIRAKGKKVALIEQDHFRITILGSPSADAKTTTSIMLGAICAAVDADCVVIVEGMLTMPKFMPLIESLNSTYPGAVSTFYLEASLEVVLDRHAGRSKSSYIPSSDVAEWYQLAKPTGLPDEVLLPNVEMTTTIDFILRHLQLND